MHVRRSALAAAVLVAALLAVDTNASAGTEGDHGSASSYWTPARRAAAIPRDLVIDEHGNGYLRRPDGTLVPYGEHNGSSPATGTQLHAVSSPSPAAKPSAQGGSSSDTTPPTIAGMDPSGGVIGSSYSFRADVTDASGVRSVSFVITYPNGTTTQSFSAAKLDSETYGVDLQGFSDGEWSWKVVAKDAAKPGNTATSATVPFTVSTGGGGGGGGGGDVIANAQWTGGGNVQSAEGRIYFRMPSNPKKTRWTGYVCSGTAVSDGTGSRSIILTAAHCVYDDVYKEFARDVLFIPDQAYSGTATDLDCSNDHYGCWSPSFGVVDSDWSSRTWPDNIPWDYAFYVVNDAGAHSGATVTSEALDEVVSELSISFNAPTATTTTAFGYSYSEDPNLMYCREDLGTDGSGWFLPSCGLSGGASGGSWLQPGTTGDEPIISVNSYGYSNLPGMGGPKLSGTSASCLFNQAKSTSLSSTGVTSSCN